MGKVTLIAGLLFLAACTTTGGSFCDIAKPIRPTPEQVETLTDSQVSELLAHNERGRRLCGWRA